MRGLKNAFLGIPLYRWLLLFCVLLVLVGVSFALKNQFHIEWTIESLRDFVENLGRWGPIIFIGILTFRFLFLIPTELLLLVGGLVFGPVEGTLYAGIGITCSGLLKYVFASIVGRDFLLRQLPDKLQYWVLSVSSKKMSVWSLGGLCAYPFLPKHIFQVSAILSGISLMPYTLAIIAGGFIRAAIFANIGDAMLGGSHIIAASIILLASIVLPLCVPSWRRWMLKPLVVKKP